MLSHLSRQGKNRETTVLLREPAPVAMAIPEELLLLWRYLKKGPSRS